MEELSVEAIFQIWKLDFKKTYEIQSNTAFLHFARFRFGNNYRRRQQ